MADGRLAQPEPAAGAGGAALLHQRLEHPKQVQVEIIEVNRLNRLHICRTPVGPFVPDRIGSKSNAASHFLPSMIPVHVAALQKFICIISYFRSHILPRSLPS